jgi:hypothetical protein
VREFIPKLFRKEGETWGLGEDGKMRRGEGENATSKIENLKSKI